MIPPLTTVGSSPPASRRAAIIEVVVVLPWVPPTATEDCSRISSASISARRTMGMRRARAAATSALSGRMAVETTTALAPSTLPAWWPTWITAPSASSRSVLAEARASEPETG